MTEKVFKQFPKCTQITIQVGQPIYPKKGENALTLTDQLMFTLAEMLAVKHRWVYAERPTGFEGCGVNSIFGVLGNKVIGSFRAHYQVANYSILEHVFAASKKATNNGWGRLGRDKNSGWNWVATMKG